MEDAEKTIKDRKENIKNKLSNWIKDEHNKIFILILTLALAIRFYIFLKTLNQPIWWDAADYLATAKRWAGLNPHMMDIWYYRRGFFWPLFSSFFFRFGLGEIGIRFMVFLFSTGIVLFSYLTIKKMFNKELALFTSLCLTFSWVILFFTGRPLTNLPASFFLIVALYFFWRGYILGEGNKFTYLFGIFFGITILTRTQYLMFAIPFFAIIFLKEKFKFLKNKNLWITVGIMFLVYLPQFIIHWGHFGNPILDLANYYLGIEGISEKAEVGVELAKFSDLFIYFGNLPYMLSKAIFSIFIIGLVYFFFDLVIGIDKIFKNKTLQTKLFILVWIVSTFIVLGYMAPHLEQRYVMQTLPFLFLIAVSPLPLIKKIITKKTKINKRIITYVLLIILLGLLIPNFLLANTLIEAKKTSFMEVKQAGEWIKENSNPEDIVMSASLPQMTYYSERSTYPYHLGYRRDLPRHNASEVEEFIEKEKPRFLIASVFEQQSRNWEYFTMTYPQKNNETIKPVQGYLQGEQPILIIYEATYKD